MIQLSLPKNIPFIKNKVYLVSISLIFIVASLVVMAKNGLNYGIDFRGGVKLLYSFSKTLSDGEVEKTLSSGGIDAMVQRYGSAEENKFTIKSKQSEETLEGTVGNITAVLEKAYGAENIVIEQQETVGPKVGQELKRKGQLAILFTLIAILVYVGIRFDFYFAPGALIALAHDVIIVLGAIALFNKEFNLSILAALLTVVGYSVNDTIIVYDRIREHGRRISQSTVETVVNECINQTLSRTIITSFTALIVLIILFIVGGGVIHDFAFCMIVGVITGTYSSIFIASPVYIWLYKNWPKISKRWGK